MNEASVVEIRLARHQGALLRELSEKYGVTMGHISRIAAGEMYPTYGGPLTQDHYKSQTHCLRGHEYTSENIVIKHGRRNCRRCKNELDNARRMKKRADAKAGA